MTLEMDESEEDPQYWISRQTKVLDEFQELHTARSMKNQEIEEQRLARIQNKKKIEELKSKIEDLKYQIYQNSPPEMFIRNKYKSNTLNISAPIISPKSMSLLQRKYTNELAKVPSQDEVLETQSENCFEYFFLLGSKPGFLEPQTLYCLPEKNKFADSPQGKALANFAFPINLITRKIKEEHFIQELLNIYDSKLKRDGRHFAFSVKSDIERPPSLNLERANYKNEILYCCCAFVEEAIDFHEGYFFFQPRCYCLLTYYPCFELLYKILFLCISKKQAADKAAIQSMLNRTTYDDHFEVLLNYKNIKCVNKLIKKFMNKKSDITEIRVDSFYYRFRYQCQELDIIWFCPSLFSSLVFEDFWYILFAILQETSVVFMSQNIDLLTSCIFGYQGLIRPYFWPHLLTPILPSSLHDILDAPVPLIAGIAVDTELSSKKKPQHLILVDLDNKNIHKRLQKPPPSFQKLFIPKTKPEGLSVCYNYLNARYNTMNKLTKAEYCSRILSFIRKNIRSILNLSDANIRRAHDIDDYIELLRLKGDDDIEFKSIFFNTQMCINYREENNLL